jgi:hypothetical protein
MTNKPEAPVSHSANMQLPPAYKSGPSMRGVSSNGGL